MEKKTQPAGVKKTNSMGSKTMKQSTKKTVYMIARYPALVKNYNTTLNKNKNKKTLHASKNKK